MNLEPDIERMKRLKRIAEYPLGTSIVYCPKCEFQYEPGALGRSECPDCGRQLHVSRVTPDLRELHGIKA